jgi:hypothetical protein
MRLSSLRHHLNYHCANPLLRSNATGSRLLPLRAFILVLAISAAGCAKSKDQGGGARSSNLQSNVKVTKAPALNVLENEAVLRGSQALIGGTVQNVSGQKIDNLLIDLELSRRDDGGKTLKQVQIMPASLSPGEEGKYSLTISNREWSGSKILRIRSGTGSVEDVAFTSQPGAKRPRERTPEGKTIVVERPRPKGEEFINTPDNPDPVR